MAYDEELAGRIRDLIGGEPDLTEQKMFGGLAFLIGGNMAIAASGQGGLLVRVDPAETDALVGGTTSPSVRDARQADGGLAARRCRGCSDEARARGVGQARRGVCALAACQTLLIGTWSERDQVPRQCQATLKLPCMNEACGSHMNLYVPFLSVATNDFVPVKSTAVTTLFRPGPEM